MCQTEKDKHPQTEVGATNDGRKGTKDVTECIKVEPKERKIELHDPSEFYPKD